ncbi:MAG: hypothetical protein RJQ09_08575 [Cyclobacteriaceae bacterium]
MLKKSELQFIVIAGPNGAGKSTISSELLMPLGIKAFDWDLIFQDNWRKFGFDPVLIQGIRNRTNEAFDEYIEKSFTNESPLAYETNFHSIHNLDLALKAREKGYKCSLYFLAVDNVITCIERVALRVKNGGHAVDEPTIRQRFKQGLTLLDGQAVQHYDKIFIHDSGSDFNLLLIIENSKIVYQAEGINKSIIMKLPNIRSLLNAESI